MTDWQPIETAPKDQQIDVWTEIRERISDVKFDSKKNYWVEIGLDSFDTLDWVRFYEKPTHWMSLPDPPIKK